MDDETLKATSDIWAAMKSTYGLCHMKAQRNDYDAARKLARLAAQLDDMAEEIVGLDCTEHPLRTAAKLRALREGGNVEFIGDSPAA